MSRRLLINKNIDKCPLVLIRVMRDNIFALFLMAPNSVETVLDRSGFGRRYSHVISPKHIARSGGVHRIVSPNKRIAPGLKEVDHQLKSFDESRIERIVETLKSHVIEDETFWNDSDMIKSLVVSKPFREILSVRFRDPTTTRKFCREFNVREKVLNRWISLHDESVRCENAMISYIQKYNFGGGYIMIPLSHDYIRSLKSTSVYGDSAGEDFDSSDSDEPDDDLVRLLVILILCTASIIHEVTKRGEGRFQSKEMDPDPPTLLEPNCDPLTLLENNPLEAFQVYYYKEYIVESPILCGEVSRYARDIEDLVYHLDNFYGYQACHVMCKNDDAIVDVHRAPLWLIVEVPSLVTESQDVILQAKFPVVKELNICIRTHGVYKPHKHHFESFLSDFSGESESQKNKLLPTDEYDGNVLAHFCALVDGSLSQVVVVRFSGYVPVNQAGHVGLQLPKGCVVVEDEIVQLGGGVSRFDGSNPEDDAMIHVNDYTDKNDNTDYPPYSVFDPLRIGCLITAGQKQSTLGAFVGIGRVRYLLTSTHKLIEGGSTVLQPGPGRCGPPTGLRRQEQSVGTAAKSIIGNIDKAGRPAKVGDDDAIGVDASIYKLSVNVSQFWCERVSIHGQMVKSYQDGHITLRDVGKVHAKNMSSEFVVFGGGLPDTITVGVISTKCTLAFSKFHFGVQPNSDSRGIPAARWDTKLIPYQGELMNMILVRPTNDEKTIYESSSGSCLWIVDISGRSKVIGLVHRKMRNLNLIVVTPIERVLCAIHKDARILSQQDFD